MNTAKMPIILAPMEGVVDAVVRKLWTEIGGIDMCVTEFIRVTDRVLPKKEFFKYCPELLNPQVGHTQAGVPVLVQLLGSDPQVLADNAAVAAELGAPGIDLNFGCPAKTVNRHDGGASLLKNPERVFKVTEAVRAAVPKSLSVSAKVRLGFSDPSRYMEIAKAAEAAGASWLTVHARTRDDGYKPPAHWEYITRIRENLKIPVIANGEVWNVGDYWQCRAVTGCESVMIGRGLFRNPFLAKQIKMSSPVSAWPDLKPVLRDFMQSSLEARGEPYAIARYKQLLVQMSRRHNEAFDLFEQSKRLESLAPALDLLNS